MPSDVEDMATAIVRVLGAAEVMVANLIEFTVYLFNYLIIYLIIY
jgi:hypothetical protein